MTDPSIIGRQLSDFSPGLPRREMLKRAGAGFGILGLAGLLQDEARAAATVPAGGGLSDNPLAPRPSPARRG